MPCGMTCSGLRKYEVINPSDCCYLYAGDPRIASVAVAIASGGRYGLKDCESGETVLYILIFSDVGKWLAGIGLDPDSLYDYIEKNATEIAKVLCSVTYRDDRSSMNNIQERFRGFAYMILEKYGISKEGQIAEAEGNDEFV